MKWITKGWYDGRSSAPARVVFALGARLCGVDFVRHDVHGPQDAEKLPQLPHPFWTFALAELVIVALQLGSHLVVLLAAPREDVEDAVSALLPPVIHLHLETVRILLVDVEVRA